MVDLPSLAQMDRLWHLFLSLPYFISGRVMTIVPEGEACIMTFLCHLPRTRPPVNVEDLFQITEVLNTVYHYFNISKKHLSQQEAFEECFQASEWFSSSWNKIVEQSKYLLKQKLLDSISVAFEKHCTPTQSRVWSNVARRMNALTRRCRPDSQTSLSLKHVMPTRNRKKM